MSKSGVVVLGASGFIGTRLVRHLSRQPELSVRALDILPPRERFDGVEYAKVDVRDPIPLNYGEGANLIYNLAAVHRTPGHPDHEYFETNVAGALNTVGLARACGIGTICFTSSISVYGPTEDTVTEQSPLKPTTSYGRSKKLAEQIHDDWLVNDASRRLVMVRPGVIFGPGEGGNYTYLAKALRRGYFAYPGRRTTTKSGGYVDELIRTMEFAIARGERRVLYNFCYPELNSTEEIVAAFSGVMGRTLRPATIPLSLMMLGAHAFELASAVGVKTPIHRERILKLVRSTRVSPGWLTSNGYNYSTDLKSALSSWNTESGGRFV